MGAIAASPQSFIRGGVPLADCRLRKVHSRTVHCLKGGLVCAAVAPRAREHRPARGRPRRSSLRPGWRNPTNSTKHEQQFLSDALDAAIGSQDKCIAIIDERLEDQLKV